MSDETQVVMAIPQDVIAAQVQAAVARVLMERGGDFIAAMVREVIDAPVLDSYGRAETRRGKDGKQVQVTKFQKLIGNGIGEAVERETSAWIEEQKDEIRKAVRAHLGRTKKDVIAQIADSIIEKLSAPRVHLSMRFGDDE